MKKNNSVPKRFAILIFLLVVIKGLAWVRWVHGETLVVLSNGAQVDTWVARVSLMPTDLNPAKMYLSSLEFGYCYKISLYLQGANGPPKVASCISLGSVQPEPNEILVEWIDRDTLRVDLGGYETIEASISLYGDSTWRRILPDDDL